MSHTSESPLVHHDPDIAQAIQQELKRQQEQIELIASENIVSRAVLEAQGSILTNKYAEGYPGKRYYGGCEFIDVIEALAIERAQKIFQCKFANVQPHSGAQANQAVMLALLNPGDTILGMDLSAGGHLTHGSKVSLSGKWFHSVGYFVHPKTHLIDMDEVRTLAKKHSPKLIIAGGSSYPRIIDFATFRSIADEVGAYLMVDMAHFSGLVAGGVYPSPLQHAHVVTSTTHKTLRCSRGGLILCQEEEIGKKINSAVFPGLQGGPLQHCIAGKAVGFREALLPSFKKYAQQVVDNAKALGAILMERGYTLSTDGTDSHLILVDLRPQNLTGKAACEALERANMTCNKNSIPFETESPFITSGIRLGTPAGTTRGFGVAEFEEIGKMIADALDHLAENKFDHVRQRLQDQAIGLCHRFPIYPTLNYA